MTKDDLKKFAVFTAAVIVGIIAYNKVVAPALAKIGTKTA